MIDGLKACTWSLIIPIVLLLDILSDRANRIFWSSPIGWLMGQAMARWIWYSDYRPLWKRWVYFLGLRPHLGQAKRGQGIRGHLWLESLDTSGSLRQEWPGD